MEQSVCLKSKIAEKAGPVIKVSSWKFSCQMYASAWFYPVFIIAESSDGNNPYMDTKCLKKKPIRMICMEDLVKQVELII